MKKKCNKCGNIKSTSQFYKRADGEPGFVYMCKDCMKLYYVNKWKKATPEEKNKRRIKSLKFYAEIKTLIHDHYGRKCVCCGETRMEFLTVDHINGGGTKHRKLLGGGNAFFIWLRNNNYPPEYRILCINCNFSMGRFGYCPHQREG